MDEHQELSDVLLQGLSEAFREALSMPLPKIDDELVTSGRLDSLAIVVLVVEIEQRFEIEISADDLDLTNFGSVRGMAEMILHTRAVKP